MFRTFALVAACATVALAGVSPASAASPEKSTIRKANSEVSKTVNPTKHDCPFKR
jgi:ABC-type oligopeptide transport system substrate-binding subunit